MIITHGRAAASRTLFALALAGFASPAMADHSGVSGVGTGSAPISIISADTLARGSAAAGFRLTFTKPESRSDAELAAFASEHIHAHSGDYTLNAAAGFAYGLTDRLTISAELPYVDRADIREGAHHHHDGEVTNDVEERGSVKGIGDLTLLGRYRLTGEGPALLSLIAGLKLPTGSTDRRDNAGERFETEHQPGTGSWDPIIGAALSAGSGPLRLHASGVYQFSGKGAQDTRLGDRFQGGLALSHRFGPSADHHAPTPHDDAGAPPHDHPEVAAHGHASWDAFVELSGEWEGRERIAGVTEIHSGGRALWLTPGARYNSASGYSIALAAGVPLWQHIRASHPDNDYRLTLSLGRAF